MAIVSYEHPWWGKNIPGNLCFQWWNDSFLFPAEHCRDLHGSVRDTALHPPGSSNPQIQEFMEQGVQVVNQPLLTVPGNPTM